MESGSIKTPLVNNEQEEARTSSSITSGLILSTSVAVTGSFVYGCAMSYSSPAQSKIMEELGLSVADYSFFTSVMTLGGMITAAFSGKIAAIIGRRQTMWISDVFCIVGWLAVAFAHDKMLLNIGRGFLGFGVGLISYVVPVYIAEITPKAFRGGFSFSNQLLQSFGISLMFFTGNFFHWRTLALLSAIPCGIQMICLFFIPESPRWLAMYGRERELEITLKRLRGENGDILEEAAEIRETVETSRRESRSGLRDLFNMKNAHPLIIGLGLMLLQQFCGSSAISAYAARILSTSVVVAGSFSYGCAMSYSSPAQSKIMEELGLSVADYSFFTSVMTLGGMITAAFSGKISALVGRRQTMWISDVCCIFGWLAVAYAHDILLLNIGRLFLGFGVGLISYVVPVYIAEITPKTFRGGFSYSNQLLQCLGISLMFFTGNFFHWRTLALLSAIPSASQVICLFFIPESPRWLAMYGRDQELEVTLKRLRGENSDILEEAAEIRETVEMSRKESRSGIRDLFHIGNAHSLIIGLGLMLLQQFCGSAAISAYAARIFDKAGFPSDIGTTILAVILIPQSIVVMLTVDRWGRRPLLMVSSIGMCICSFLIGLSYYLQKYGEFHKFCSVMLIVGLVGYVSSFGIGLGGLPWVIMSEVFPVNVKITAGSLVTMSNWFFNWIIIYSFNFMIQWSASGTYFIFSGVSMVTIVFIWTLVPETKGRTLEEIQASLVRLS